MTQSGGLPITTPVFTEPGDGLVAIAPGCFVTPETLGACQFPDQVHFLQVLAAVQRYPDAYVSGLSALIFRRIPVVSAPATVSLLHHSRHGLSRDGDAHFYRRSSSTPRLAHKLHAGTRDILCVRADFALLDALRWSITELSDAVAVTDSVLRVTKLKKKDLLASYQKQCADVPRNRRILIDRALTLAIPGVDSIRESQMRMELYARGYPPPLVHPQIFDVDGYTHLATPDLYYPDARVALEYDGAGKHRGDFGDLPADSLTIHHTRADRLTTRGVRVIHVNNARFKSGAWVNDLDDALGNHLGPLPAKQVRGGIPAWENKRGPRWKMDSY